MHRLQAMLAATLAALCPAACAAQEAADDGISLVRGEVYTQRFASGLPLGGIGAGKIELFTDGTLGNLTINNNWEYPMDGPAGAFGAMYVRQGELTTARLLRSGQADLPTCRETVFRGRFPRAEIEFADPALPVQVSLEAFSPLIPHDYRFSILPVAVFTYRVHNPTPQAAEVSLLFSWENILGVTQNRKLKLDDRTGNYQEPAEEKGLVGVTFHTTRQAKGLEFMGVGDYALACLAPEGFEVSRCLSWNARDRGRFWDSFKRDGVLESPAQAPAGKQGQYHPAAALATKGTLQPEQSARVTFVLAWNMRFYIGEDDPQFNLGHRYSHQGRTAWEFATDVASRVDELHRGVREWQALLEVSSLPSWLQHKLMNDCFTLYANTLYTRDGRFATLESPTAMWGSAGTMDQRLSAHVLYTTFFPELDTAELRLFAQLQQPTGEIPHLNGNVFDTVGRADVKYGLTQWPDLSCSFIMQVHKYYLWTGDRPFVDEMYPRVQKALRWLRSRDTDGDLIPEGGSTWDYKHYPGAFSYTASVWLAALRSAEELAKLQGDASQAAQCAQWLQQARQSVMEELWNGRYFIKFYNPKDRQLSTSCFTGALAGEWFGHLVGLEHLLPEHAVTTDIRTALDLCRGLNAFVPPNEVEADGRWPADDRSWVQYMETYFAGLAIYQGYATEGLEWVRRINEAVVRANRSPWDAHLAYSARTGAKQWGPWYMTNPASWFVLYALEGFAVDVNAGMLQVQPHLPASEWELRAPVFAPTFWAWLDYKADPNSGRSDLDLKLIKQIAPAPMSLRELRTILPPAVPGADSVAVVKLNNKLLDVRAEYRGQEVILRLPQAVTFSKDAVLHIALVPNIRRQIALTAETDFPAALQPNQEGLVKLHVRNDLELPVSGFVSLELPPGWAVVRAPQADFRNLGPGGTATVEYPLRAPAMAGPRRYELKAKAVLDVQGKQVQREASLGLGSAFVRNWYLVAPFDNPGEHEGLAKVYGPEEAIAGGKLPDLQATYQGKLGPVGWKLVQSRQDQVDLVALLGPLENVVAYALSYVYSPRAQPVLLLVGSDDGVKVFLNGEQVFVNPVSRGAKPDDDRVDADLKQGWNQVLLKVDTGGGGWGLYFQVADPDGNSLEGLQYAPVPPKAP